MLHTREWEQTRRLGMEHVLYQWNQRCQPDFLLADSVFDGTTLVIVTTELVWHFLTFWVFMYIPVIFTLSAGLGTSLVTVLVNPGIRLADILLFWFLCHPDRIYGLFVDLLVFLVYHNIGGCSQFGLVPSVTVHPRLVFITETCKFSQQGKYILPIYWRHVVRAVII